MNRLKWIVGWLGIEANARAITTLLTMGAFLGGLVVFVWNQVLPVASPQFANTSFGEGYRRDRREAMLEILVRRLEETLKNLEIARRIEEEVSKMTDDEIDKELADWFRNRSSKRRAQ